MKYYRTYKKSFVPLIFEWPTKGKNFIPTAVNYFDGESPGRADIEALLSFQNKNQKPYRLLLLTQTRESYTESLSKKKLHIEVHPLRG